MPYKSSSIPLSETQDRRCKLTEAQRDEIRHRYATESIDTKEEIDETINRYLSYSMFNEPKNITIKEESIWR